MLGELRARQPEREPCRPSLSFPITAGSPRTAPRTGTARSSPHNTRGRPSTRGPRPPLRICSRTNGPSLSPPPGTRPESTSSPGSTVPTLRPGPVTSDWMPASAVTNSLRGCNLPLRKHSTCRRNRPTSSSCTGSTTGRDRLMRRSTRSRRRTTSAGSVWSPVAYWSVGSGSCKSGAATTTGSRGETGTATRT
jgi:hypothetical protein